MKLLITTEQKMYYALRVASAMCFIGHGIFGIITKQIWCNYFGVFGIGTDLSYQLMPFVGAIDIACGLIILLFPLRAVILWLVIWGLITAFLRPLSGEPFAELIERAGNFGAPLVLILISGGIGKNFKTPFQTLASNIRTDDKTMANVTICLRVMVFLLFLGHGWLNIIEKKGLIDQYTSLGFPNPVKTANTIGLFEIIAAFTVLIRPVRSVIMGLLIWKMTSELLYPHYELFEWIERGGSYGVLLALWFALEKAPILKGISKYSIVNRLPINRKKTTTNYFSLAGKIFQLR